jgi:sortase A
VSKNNDRVQNGFVAVTMKCMHGIRILERLLLVLGLSLLAFYGGARIHRTVLSRAEVSRFKTERLRLADQKSDVEFVAADPDVSLWSPKRIRDYEDSLSSHFAPAVAVLRVPKIHVEVPVLEGTDDLTLNRGVGRIAGTSIPGEEGNIGIAGHRDGFFRGLKDVGLGDTIEMLTADRMETYVIDRIFITDTNDVSVLARREHPSLTLVTCYPFYFVGSAPKRYIVQAYISNSAPAGNHISARSTTRARVLTDESTR